MKQHKPNPDADTSARTLHAPPSPTNPKDYPSHGQTEPTPALDKGLSSVEKKQLPRDTGSVVGRQLDLEHRGPLAELLAWLGAVGVTDLRIEPLGLGKIYRSFHAAG